MTAGENNKPSAIAEYPGIGRTYSPWQQALAPPACNVAIIGGGLIGCATAWALHQIDPTLRLTIVEAEHLAFGASGRNAGFLLLGTHTDYAAAVEACGRERARRLWQFTAENARLLDELPGETFDLRRSGSLSAAGSPREATRLFRAAELLARDGVEAEYLDADAANDQMRSRGFLGALAVKESGTLHPAKLVRLLAQLSGATVLEGWRVNQLLATSQGVRLVSDQNTLEATQVIVTINAFLPQLVTSEAVRPVRAQMLATAPVAPFLDRPVYSHDGYYYLRQQRDGRLFVGGARHLHREEEVGYEDRTTDILQKDLLGYLQTHFPAAGAPVVERRWSGTMGFSDDGLPIVDTVPGVPGARWAAGFTGHGLSFGARFGQLLARLTLGLDDDAADLFSHGHMRNKRRADSRSTLSRSSCTPVKH